MTPKKSPPQKTSQTASSGAEPGASLLRAEAEARLSEKGSEIFSGSELDARRQLHELQVHQIELEMMNDELVRTRAELEESQARYFNLFDLAPVGILTLNEEGLILETNLTAASQLGLTRDKLVNRELAAFILKEDRDLYYLHRRELFENGLPQECEMRMHCANGSTLWVNGQSTILQGENGIRQCQVILSNITRSKQSEQELVESEQRLQKVLQNSPDIIYSFDISTRTTIFFNRDELFGYSKQELEKPGSIMAFVHPDDLPGTRQSWNQVLNGEDLEPIEFRLFNKSGETIWLRQRITVISNDMAGKPKQILVTLTDITERKLVSQKIATSEAELRALFAAIKDVVIKYDAEGRYLEIAPTNPTNHYLPVDEMLGKTVHDILPKEKADFIQGRITESLQTGKLVSCEYSLSMDNGEVWFTVIVSPVSDNTVIWVAHDITSMKHAADTLQESERRFRQTLENVSLIAIEFDYSGNITFANDFFLQLTGWQYDEIIGKNWFSTCLPDRMIDEITRVFKEVLATGDAPNHHENVIITRLGEERLVYWSNTVLRDPAGKPVGISSIGEDITARKTAEQKLQESAGNMQAILDADLDSVFLIEPDGTILAANLGLANRFNRNRDELVGSNTYDLVPKEVADSRRKHVDQVITSGKPLRFEDQRSGLTIENSIYPVLGEQGKVVRLAVFGHDITERKKAEISLAESEERFRLMIENAPLGYQSLDIDGNFIHVNPAWLEILGYESKEVIGHWFGDFLVPEHRDAFRERFPIFKAAGQIYSEFKMLHKNGSTIFVAFEGRIGYDAAGEFKQTHCMLQDITEKRRAEEKLTRSESELKKAQAYAHVGSWIWNIKTGKLEWSDEMYNIFGISKETFSGNLQEVVASAIHPADRQKVEASNSSVATAGKPIPLEYRILLPDGSQRVVWGEAGELEKDAEGNPALLRGIVMDITARKQAEEELREERQRMAGILQGTNAGTWEWNVQTGKTIFNDRWAEMIGYTLDEISPISIETWLKYAHPDDLKVSNVYLEKHFRGESDYYEFESRMKHKDGNWIWIVDKGKVISWAEDGKPLVMMGTHQDITDRKQAEEALIAERNFARQITNSMGQGLTVTDEQGRFEYVNPAYAKMVGYDPKDLLGLSPQEMSTPEARLVLQKARNSRQRGETTTYEIDLKHSAGHLVPVMVTGVPRRDAGVITGTIAVITDLTERKQAEGEIRRMAQMLDIAPNSITVHDFDGRFLFANQKSFDLHGYTRAEFMGLNLHHLDLPESEELIAQRMQDIMERGEATFEVRHYHKDGSILPMEVQARLTSWDDQKVLLSVGTDIRERKQAEDALQKSRDLLNTTGKMAKVGGWEIDTAGHTLAWTEETLHIHELAPGSQPDVASALNFYHPDDRVQVASAVEQALTTGQPFDFETRLITALGKQIWVRSSGQAITQHGKITGVRGSIQDITDRKLAEESLRESEAKFHQIFDISPVGIVMVGLDERFILCNHAFSNSLGYGTEELVGKLIEDITLPEDNHIGMAEMKAIMKGEIAISQVHKRYIRKEGQVVWGEVTISLIRDSEGHAQYFLAIIQDITERKLAEDEIRRHVEELDGLQKTVLDITAAQSLPGLLESIVERACQLLGAPGGGLYMNDIKKEEVRCAVSYNTRINYTGVVIKHGEGVAGRVAQTGEPLYIEDYMNWTGRAQNFELDRPFSVVLGVPLLWGGQVRGVIDILHFEEGKSFSQDDIELINIFAGHAAIAIENSRLLEASQVGEAQVRALSTRLAEAEENERRRIARELHDQVGQSLSALSINMNIMHSQVPEFLPGFKRRLDDSLMLIDQTTDHIRHLMSELRPAVLDDYGLKAALDWAVGSIAKRTNLKLLVEGECNRFPPRIEIALFRIAQEALGNIARHAHARHVKILLTQDGAEMSMSVTDDGIGFDPSSVEATEKSGWGLRLMAERAESIGASLQVESTPGKGTCITARYHDDNSTGR